MPGVPVRRLLGLAARGVALALITIGVAELALQAAALFVRDRQRGWRADAPRRVLCVGDSHTFGALVPAEESYPGHLQRLLDARAPGTFSVRNLGIPGMNTSQVRSRLHVALASEPPDLVIVWCGVNNAWNRRASSRGAGWWPALDERLQGLRLYRLARVWWHDWGLERAAGAGGRQRAEIVRHPDRSRHFAIGIDGHTERIEYDDGGLRADPEMEERAARDYRAMVEDARAAGVPLAFIAYPVDHVAFALANRAMRRVAAELHVPVVESERAVARLLPEQRKLLAGAHPTGAMYGAVAEDLVPLVLGEPARAADAPLVRLAFDTGPDPAGSGQPCGRTTTECAHGAGCFRWHTGSGVCKAQDPLADVARAARASFSMRVTTFPGALGPHDFFALLENTYGTGVGVVFTDTNRVRLSSIGSASKTGGCGPLAPRLRPGVWYQVHLRAEKSDHARLSLELRDQAGTLLDAAVCADQPTGAGFFSHVMLGSANPIANEADVRLDDVEVVRK